MKENLKERREKERIYSKRCSQFSFQDDKEEERQQSKEEREKKKENLGFRQTNEKGNKQKKTNKQKEIL